MRYYATYRVEILADTPEEAVEMAKKAEQEINKKCKDVDNTALCYVNQQHKLETKELLNNID